MKNPIQSINLSITFTDTEGHRTVQTGIMPSHGIPDIKALLDLIVSSVNEECGTNFQLQGDNPELKPTISIRKNKKFDPSIFLNDIT